MGMGTLTKISMMIRKGTITPGVMTKPETEIIRTAKTTRNLRSREASGRSRTPPILSIVWKGAFFFYEGEKIDPVSASFQGTSLSFPQKYFAKRVKYSAIV